MQHINARRALYGLLTALVLAGTASAAQATVHRSEYGANVVQSIDRNVTAYDNECDGNWVRGNYNMSGGGSGGVDATGGCSTWTGKNASRIATAVQICESRPAQPMACSSWNTEY